MSIRRTLNDENKVLPQSRMEKVKNKLWGFPSSIKLFTTRILDRLFPYFNLRWSFCAFVFAGIIIRFYYSPKHLWLFFWYLPFAVSAIHRYYEPKHIENDWFAPKHEKEDFKISKTNREYKPFTRARGEFEVWTLLCSHNMILFCACFFNNWTNNFSFWWIANCGRAGICMSILIRLGLMSMVGYNSDSIIRAKKTATFFMTKRKKENAVKKPRKRKNQQKQDSINEFENHLINII